MEVVQPGRHAADGHRARIRQAHRDRRVPGAVARRRRHHQHRDDATGTARSSASPTSQDGDELLLITQQGMILRMQTNDVRAIGRATQGVRLIDIEGEDKVVSIARLVEKEDESGRAREPEPSLRSACRSRRRSRRSAAGVAAAAGADRQQFFARRACATDCARSIATRLRPAAASSPVRHHERRDRATRSLSSASAPVDAARRLEDERSTMRRAYRSTIRRSTRASRPSVSATLTCDAEVQAIAGEVARRDARSRGAERVAVGRRNASRSSRDRDPVDVESTSTATRREGRHDRRRGATPRPIDDGDSSRLSSCARDRPGDSADAEVAGIERRG